MDATDRRRFETQYYGCCVVDLYLKYRTHVSLDKDAPVSRPVATPPDGAIVAIPHLGGLHHHYERRAA
jgi:putative transposase